MTTAVFQCNLHYDADCDNRYGFRGIWRARALVGAPTPIQAESRGSDDPHIALEALERELRIRVNLKVRVAVHFQVISVIWPNSRGGVEPGGGPSDG